ncbi:hypothetical protein T439DRAFT_380431 [Meredithblackwellia eburnea MCA 4105]
MPTVIDPEYVLSQLGNDEKALLLSGGDRWHTAAIPRLGVPRVRTSDGPNGVRGIIFLGGTPASCFPAATALGASFDVSLVKRIGEGLGEECRARGVHCLLGPTTNIQRSPLGGRGFESYAEDPYLSGAMGLAWVEGVQSKKVMCTPKHFICNEQEFRRFSSNSIIDERTLQEIYAEPFRLQCKGKPHGFMSSYNKVNGTHVAESPYLLRELLRDTFGFTGLVMSDWSGTYSGGDGVKAGVDLEMPGPAIMRGISLEREIMAGKLEVEDLDDCALRVLNFVKTAQESGIPFEAEEKSIDTPEVRALLLESAREGIVLLKNDAKVLPLTEVKRKKIAVIGPNANASVYSGGGSARLPATYTTTPLAAIKKLADEQGAVVVYEEGARTNRWSAELTPYLCQPGSDKVGVLFEWYDKDPRAGNKIDPLFLKTQGTSYAYFVDGIPASVPVRGYTLLRSTFTPHVSGIWEFGLGVAGQADLYLDGKLVVNNSENQVPGLLFFMTGAEERVGRAEVKAGQSYELEVRFSNFKQINMKSPYAGRRGGIRVGGAPVVGASESISKAVKLSQEADVTILVVGTNEEWESESYDRDDLKLPAGSDKLVEAVLKATPNTIVVNQSGMPVEFPWVENCSTLIQAFFGGNESGTAIADAIFGKHNPSGKLPVTFPVKLEDSPSYECFGHPTTTVYKEGIKVGYRFFDRPGNVASAFPFGHGLSYSTFTYTNLSVQALPKFGLSATFTITNTGKLAGSESAQVYIHDQESRVERPEIELKGMAKVFLKPGESKTVTVEMDHSAFSFYDISYHKWIGEKGVFEVRIGASSTNIVLAAPFDLAESFSWVGLQDPVPFKYHKK